MPLHAPPRPRPPGPDPAPPPPPQPSPACVPSAHSPICPDGHLPAQLRSLSQPSHPSAAPYRRPSSGPHPTPPPRSPSLWELWPRAHQWGPGRGCVCSCGRTGWPGPVCQPVGVGGGLQLAPQPSAHPATPKSPHPQYPGLAPRSPSPYSVSPRVCTPHLSSSLPKAADGHHGPPFCVKPTVSRPPDVPGVHLGWGAHRADQLSGAQCKCLVLSLARFGDWGDRQDRVGPLPQCPTLSAVGLRRLMPRWPA